jgi:transcriptional regulator with XRE-family HTH domain
MDGNAFGKLVRTYREQRGWKQEDLAERWGFTRVYVSQIERGQRKLEKQEHIIHLADILGIPEEQLEAVGKIIPRKKTPLEGDDILLQALLAPTQETLKLSWLAWQTNSTEVDLGQILRDWQGRLSAVLDLYHGQFRPAALRILGYIHEMLGKMAIERAATQEATAHFQEMYDIAEELGDSDMCALALIHLSEMFRRRGRYEASFRRIEAAEIFIQKHGKEVSTYIQGVLWKAYAITCFSYGDEQRFLRTIDRAEAIAEKTEATIDTLRGEFDKVEVLQVRAIGLTTLWKPASSLAIYPQTDTLRPLRPLRDLASYHIIKAQTYCGVGDTKKGIEYAMTGLNMAESLHSTRYVIRLLQMSDRLRYTPIGKEQGMEELRQEILEVLRKMNN